MPVNLIKLAAEVIARNLAATTPRALVTATRRDLKSVANAFSLALNKVLEWTHIEEDLQTWVYEAIFSPFGIMKVSLDVSEYVEIDGEAVATGQPKIEPVLFDDWVHDMSARNLRQCAFYGHRFLMDKEEAQNNPLFDDSAKEYLKSFQDRGWGDSDKHDSQSLSRHKTTFGEDYRDMVELWELYLPLERLVITLPSVDTQTPTPLRVVEWTGPEEGPYHFLYFTPVPGNTLPLPPVSVWRDLHELANNLFNKLGRQASRQKSVGVCPTAMSKDIERLMSANDGEVISADLASKEQFVEISTGKLSKENYTFFLETRGLFNWFAGNLESLAGLAPQSGTLGQDQMLAQSASHLVQGMQEKVKYATARLMKSAGWFLWNDPAGEVPIEFRIQGSQETQSAMWTPERRKGEWMDFLIDIEPYSMTQKSPGEQLEWLMRVWNETIIPSLPLMEAQGISPNFEAFFKLLAALSNQPALNDLVLYLQGQMEGTSEPMAKPNTSVRKYERVSKSAKTRAGADAVMKNTLMGGNPQAAESNQMMRGMGT